MNVCVYIYIGLSKTDFKDFLLHAYIQINIYTNTTTNCTKIFTNADSSMYVYTPHKFTYVHIHIHINTHTHTHINTHTHTHTSIIHRLTTIHSRIFLARKRISSEHSPLLARFCRQVCT